jgi:hypothetical protein
LQLGGSDQKSGEKSGEDNTHLGGIVISTSQARETVFLHGQAAPSNERTSFIIQKKFELFFLKRKK